MIKRGAITAAAGAPLVVDGLIVARSTKRHQDLVLENAAFDRFIAALDDDATPVAELVDLFRTNPAMPST